MPIPLPQPQLIEIVGADAVAFAHAQFSNDVVGLPPGHWQWNAWLSPQGRVRHVFLLLRDAEDRLSLLLRGGNAEAMRAALARFVFRAKLSLRAVSDVRLSGCDEAEALASLPTLPRDDSLVRPEGIVGLMLPGLPPRWLLLIHAGPAAPAPAEALNQWRLDDIRAGLPELDAMLEDQFLPQWLGLGRLQAINVRKGCYPGQEIMARLHFKGGNKRGLYRLQMSCRSLPASGTRLLCAQSPISEAGVLLTAAWSAADRAEALAVLVDSAATDDLHIESTTVDEIKVVSGFA